MENTDNITYFKIAVKTREDFIEAFNAINGQINEEFTKEDNSRADEEKYESEYVNKDNIKN